MAATLCTLLLRTYLYSATRAIVLQKADVVYAAPQLARCVKSFKCQPRAHPQLFVMGVVKKVAVTSLGASTKLLYVGPG